MDVRILTEFVPFSYVIFSYNPDAICLLAERFFSLKNPGILHFENTCMQSSFSITRSADSNFEWKIGNIKERESPLNFLSLSSELQRLSILPWHFKDVHWSVPRTEDGMG